MSNPWMKKNPFMSLWLSGANRVANTARGSIAAQAKRQSSAAVNQASNDLLGIWTRALTGAAPPARRKKR